jgi:L-proline---[L-prolyl-carrier protein] ligase
MALHHYLDKAAEKRPDHEALQEPGGGSINYRDFVALTEKVRDRLVHLGVKRGDRVGLYMRKSIDALSVMLGASKAGAAYVPVDPLAPPSRNAYIHNNCGVKVIFVESKLEPAFRAELEKLGPVPMIMTIEGTGAGAPLRTLLDEEQRRYPAAKADSASPRPEDLAYILYTSGSTGKPKGVMISHQNAMSFVDWCSEVFEPRPEDRFSNHAPFHFDISVLDIYTAIKHGCTLVLIPEEAGKEPTGLAKMISEMRISIWYSAPSILSLLAQYGNLPAYDFSNLRMVLFAGEVFPVVHLRALSKLWPRPRYFNLYGPTETNVCTWYEVQLPVPEDRKDAYPIGKACSHYRGLVVDTEGNEVQRGAEGELVMTGPGVMLGYWQLPEQSSKCFLTTKDGTRWYKTGDLVTEEPNGDYKYVGRRDRMVKKRGYRVELGEIEATLYRHPMIREVAVIALKDEVEGIKVVAHVSTRDEKKLSIIEVKRFCSENLPIYMIPDAFKFHPALPKTSTDKVDYEKLKSAV